MTLNLLPILLITVPVIIAMIIVCTFAFVIINEIRIYREYLTELRKDDEEERI